MSNIRISQLPAAPVSLTGAELVPVVQNGQTVQTTVSAITTSPSLTQTFITVSNTPSLANSRYLGATNGLTITDGGAQSVLNITSTGALLSLVNSGTGFQVKTSSTAITNRSIAVSGNGIAISNGSGVSGDPTLSLSGQILNFANASFNGLVTLSTAGAITSSTITGTANQIDVANGTGVGGNPTLSITANPVIPGSEGIALPSGNTGQRSVSPANGTLRYNTTTALLEAYLNNVWASLASGSGVTSIVTGTGLTGGPITSTGTISIANTTVVAGTYGSSTQVPSYTVNAQGQLTSAANISISATSIGAVTSVTGTANEIDSTGGQTPVISLPSAITLTGKTVAGGSYNMTAASVASDVVTTNTAAQTLTNKTINGSNNTLTNIGNASLTNSSVTIGTTAIALGGSSLTLGGLTSVAVTQDPTTAFQLATKQYVDTATSTGLTYHQPVQAATTTALTGVVTYNNGTAGVGATLTLGTPLTTLDGYTLLNTNRVLIKDQANQIQNGIYTWATGGTVLTRATDADTYGSGTNQLSLNDYFFTQNGTVNKGVAYVLSAPVGTITFGTSNIQFAEFSTSQVYTGTAPINISGTVISLTTVPVNLGGTNITSYTAGDLLYATGSTTLTKLPIGVAGRVLKSTGTAPDWQLNATYLPVVLHNTSVVQISVASGFLPVLLHDGVTTVNVTLF